MFLPYCLSLLFTYFSCFVFQTGHGAFQQKEIKTQISPIVNQIWFTYHAMSLLFCDLVNTIAYLWADTGLHLPLAVTLPTQVQLYQDQICLNLMLFHFSFSPLKHPHHSNMFAHLMDQKQYNPTAQISPYVLKGT